MTDDRLFDNLDGEALLYPADSTTPDGRDQLPPDYWSRGQVVVKVDWERLGERWRR